MPRGRPRSRARASATAAAAAPAPAASPSPAKKAVTSPVTSPVKPVEMAFEEGDEVMAKWPGMLLAYFMNFGNVLLFCEIL